MKDFLQAQVEGTVMVKRCGGWGTVQLMWCVQLGEETWILRLTQFGLQAMRLGAYVHRGLPSVSLLWKPSIESSVSLTNSKSVESAMRLSTTVVLLNLSHMFGSLRQGLIVQLE